MIAADADVGAEADMLRPRDEAEIAEAIRAASGPLIVEGGGTRPLIPAAVDRLSTRELTGITLYEPGALTLSALAGTPLSEIEAALDAEGQMLPFEPMDHRRIFGTRGEPTIGGVVAGNVSGPRRVVAGACRDLLLGVRFVDGTGTPAKSGGRVMKNVTGYDLCKLMAGSWGTLGVITQATFKVLPKPGATATLICEGLGDAEAVAAMSAALGTPYGVSAAAHVSGGETWLRLEGLPDSVAYRSEALARAMSRHGRWRTDDDPGAWSGIRDAAAVAGGEGDVWRLSLRASDAAALVAEIAPRAALYDWGGALVWLLTEPGRDLRVALGGAAGHATLVRASDETRNRLGTFHPETAPLARMAAALKDRFDPRGIFPSLHPT